MDMMDTAGQAGYLKFDISIVRGLSYYTGPVFEVNSPDKNIGLFAAEDDMILFFLHLEEKQIPAVGFGFGDVVVLDVLKELGRFPELPKKTRLYNYSIHNEQVGIALKIASDLRMKGYVVTVISA